MTSSGKYSIRLLATAFVFCVAGVQAQVQMQTKPGIQTERPATSLRPAPASVEIVALSATPAAPKEGEMVTVKLSIRNSGQSAVAQVPWSIHWNTANQTLAQGVQPNVVPGAVFEVTASWRAVPGEQLFKGYVDGSGKTFNNAAPVANRIANLPLTIAQVSASTQGAAPGQPVTKVTQILDYQKAKLAGAQFAHNEEAVAACTYLGQFDSKVQFGNWPDGTVSFGAVCALLGGRATPEAFKNFRLKNGWRIKSVEPLKETKNNGDWQWVTGPPTGDNPYMQVRVWANSLGEGSIILKVVIEGPEGSDPYK